MSRKLTFKIETVTKICKESHISKLNNMGHRRYEHRILTQGGLSEASQSGWYDG